ncbi:hypothetical protein CBR_g49044 [Chara braunii]|uniref:CCHC-type domain-containing protein n=1 Tax=Chara braunii TaxID=69332 RepID=A0A388M420_CHABU|nr:hypothetical protein CBR_g49044 [Chara braunii]|eukprot:GBG89334.1 hypothetical protein CBR_g49044 [Chara braunii]
MRCYNCNQPGHLAKDCPKPRTQGGSAGPSQIPLAAPTAVGQGRVATVIDTGTMEMVPPAAAEIGPDEYMAAAMLEPETIGVIRHLQRITEESDLGPWRPGFEDLAAPGPEYKDGNIDVLDALKALDLRIPVPIPYLLTISEAANEKLTERCLKNGCRFEESRKRKKLVINDPQSAAEGRPSTSRILEANRVGMIQAADLALEKPKAYDMLLGIPWQAAVGARMHFDNCKVVLTSAHPKPQTISMRLVVRTRAQSASRISTKVHRINMIRWTPRGELRATTETDNSDEPDRYPIRIQDWWRQSWRREPMKIVRSAQSSPYKFAPILARPDPTKPFALHTDWHPQAISAVLTQQGADGKEHVIEYASKTLTQAQSNYEACKGECLAVVWGIQHFRPYLYGQKFVLLTDHQPLLSLRDNTDYTGTSGRWAVEEEVVDFHDEKPLRPPSSYPRLAAPKAPKRTPNKRRHQPSPEAQGSRIGPVGEVIQHVTARKADLVPESKAAPIGGPRPGEEVGIGGSRTQRNQRDPIPPPPPLPDLNLDGTGPSAAAAAGGGVGGVPYPASRPPILAGQFRFRHPPRGAPVIDLNSSSESDGPPDGCRIRGGACNHQARGNRGDPAP